MKKSIVSILSALLCLSLLAGCGGKSGFDAGASIGVISREEGSGTRSAFIELFGIEQKNDAGEKVDLTTPAAAITNSTSVMMTTVAGDPCAIGYISLGSLNDSVKALSIDGAAASVENIKNGSYKIARPFNVAVRDDLSAEAQDFLNFILSAQGQAVVEENGCIAVAGAETYASAVTKGRSSSAAPAPSPR